jgi:hypothetical protein
MPGAGKTDMSVRENLAAKDIGKVFEQVIDATLVSAPKQRNSGEEEGQGRALDEEA